MRIERNEIQVLNVVVEEGSFSRAAERLNLSQSAVSQAIANLEHKLDAPLLIRGAPTKPTEAGLRLFSFAQTVEHEEANALEDLARIKSGTLTTLNLAINSMVNRLHGRELLLTFCARNPLTSLKLDVAPSREIVRGVAEDRWELGFGPFERRMPGQLQTHAFFTEQRTLVVHRNHPAYEALRRTPAQCLGEATLLTSYLDDAAQRPAQRPPHAPQRPPRLRNVFGSVWEISNFSLRIALCEAGMGVTYVSDRMLDSLDGFTRIDGPAFANIHRRVGLYYKKHKPLSEAAKRFAAICRDYFRGSAPQAAKN